MAGRGGVQVGAVGREQARDHAVRLMNEGRTVKIICVGKKGYDILRRQFERQIVDFVELHGDRAFADDQAIQGGFATFRGRKVMVLGHEKGDDTASRLRHNFGMAKPEGYRKAIRLMQLADRFGLPVVTLVDTPGAFPGVQAEERGQGWAIAESLATLADVRGARDDGGGDDGAATLVFGDLFGDIDRV